MWITTKRRNARAYCVFLQELSNTRKNVVWYYTRLELKPVLCWMRIRITDTVLTCWRFYFCHFPACLLQELLTSRDWTTLLEQTMRKGQVAGVFWEELPWRLALLITHGGGGGGGSRVTIRFVNNFGSGLARCLHYCEWKNPKLTRFLSYVFQQ
jgi:hypothetical protein